MIPKTITIHAALAIPQTSKTLPAKRIGLGLSWPGFKLFGFGVRACRNIATVLGLN